MARRPLAFMILPALAACFFSAVPAGAGSVKGVGSVEANVEAEAKAPPVVAEVGDTAITVAAFEEHLEDRPPSRGVRGGEDYVDRRLEGMVLEEALYQEALRRGLDGDPEIKGRLRRMLVQRLIEVEVEEPARRREIGEEEIGKYYEARREEYDRPEQVRLAVIFIAAPPEAAEGERAELRAQAEAIRDEAERAAAGRNGFGELVRKYPDSTGRYPDGQTGFFGIDGAPAGIAPAVASAAFGLERNGSVAGEAVETPEGFHIIMRTGKRAAVHVPLEQVRSRLEHQIREEERRRKRKEYLDMIREAAAVRIDAEAVAGVVKTLEKRQAAGSRRAGGGGARSAGPPLPAEGRP